MIETGITTISNEEYLRLVDIERNLKEGKLASFYNRQNDSKLLFYNPTEIMETLTKSNTDLVITYTEIRNESIKNKSLLDRANKEIERFNKMSVLEFLKFKRLKNKKS